MWCCIQRSHHSLQAADRLASFTNANRDRLIQSGNGIGVDALGDFAKPFEVSSIVNLRCVRYRTCHRSRTYPFENQLDNLGRQFIQHLCRIRSRRSNIRKPRSRAPSNVYRSTGSSVSFGLPFNILSCLGLSQFNGSGIVACYSLWSPRTRNERLQTTVSEEYHLA